MKLEHSPSPDWKPLPEWSQAETVEQWLACVSRLGQPHWPLDLLPLLRMRYSRLLKDSILSVVIQPDGARYGEFDLQIADSISGMRGYTLITETPAQIPVITEFLDRCTDLDFVRELGLFDEGALSILSRLAHSMEDDTELENLRGAASHYLRCARILASHIVKSTDLEAATVALMKSAPATGIADDEAGAHTLWDELVDGAVSDSILWETWNNEVSSAVDEVFEHKQPFAVQLAFWLDDDSLSEEIENYEFGDAPDRLAEFGLGDLCDTHLITQKITEAVISLAMHEREEKTWAAEQASWNED